MSNLPQGHVLSLGHPHAAWFLAATEILALSGASLHARIAEEVAANPALEVEEHPTCAMCGRVLKGHGCPACLVRFSATEAQADDASLLQDRLLWRGIAGTTGTDDSVDPPWAQVHLREHLLLTLQLAFPPQDTPLIEYLIASLDAEGYFDGTIEAVAQRFGVSCRHVQRILAVLQAQEPAGIGARDVRECLLLQLHRLEAYAALPPAVGPIIDHHWLALGQRKYGEIARALGIPTYQVEQALALIKAAFTPFPLARYLESTAPPGAQPGGGPCPDVIIGRWSARAGRGYTVEVVEAQRYTLQISASYLEAPQNLRHSPGEAEELRRANLTRTRRFIADIKRRWQTLATLTQCLIEFQPDFLEYGRAAIRPLSRADVSACVGWHPLTVCRATAHKYIMLPTTQVVPCSAFFETRVQHCEPWKAR